MIDYTKKIGHVHEYQGEVFPSATIDPADSTLKDQILILLDFADQNYAEVLAGEDVEVNDPTFLLYDIKKILDGAINNLSEKFYDDEGNPR
tara:strand:+ start:818 stop:1090 length:273 start_codon:yes stop_codon:yes gene_type:complete